MTTHPQTRFVTVEDYYYPDLMVCCDPADCADDYCTHPGLIIEVLSESTERIDRGEKLWSYRQIDSLQAYLILSREEVKATLYRRESGWRAETFSDPGAVLDLPCAGLKLALASVYETQP